MNTKVITDAKNIIKIISEPWFRDEVLKDCFGTRTRKMYRLFKRYKRGSWSRSDSFLDFGDIHNMQQRLIAAIPYINNDKDAIFTICHEKPYANGSGVFNVKLKEDAMLRNVIEVLAIAPPVLTMNPKDLFDILKEYYDKEHVIFPFTNKVQMSIYFDRNWEAITKEVDLKLRKPRPSPTGKYYLGCSSRGATDRIICGDTSLVNNNTKEVTR